MKKFLSIVLSLALLVGNLSLVSLIAAEDNLIANGTFETDSKGWYWSKGISAENFHAGKQSLQLGTGNYTRTFTCVDVTPNTDYVYSFWYYAPAGGSWWGGGWYVNGAPADVNKGNPTDYFFNGAKAAKLANGSYSACEEGVWKQASVTFNSASYEVAVLEFTNHDGKEIYIDDVSLKVYEKDDAIIKNGSFENGTLSWETGDGAVTEEEHYSGSSSFRLASNGNYKKMYQKFTVEKNTDYIVSFYYKGTAIWMNKWGVATEVNVEPNGRMTGGTLSTVQKWTRATGKFNSGDNTELYFAIMSGTGADMYIDKVSVKADDSAEKIIKNGSFESETDYWSGSADISEEQHYDGKASAKLTKGNYAKLYQEFDVTPNTNYTVTFYYKGTATWMNKWAVRDTAATNPEKDQSILQGVLSTSKGWKEVTEDFNSGNNTRLQFIMMTGSDSDIYLDGVSVVLKPYDIEDDLLIKNYSFERGKEKWDGIDGTKICVTDEEAASGEYSLAFKEGNYIKAWQGFNVEKNTDYIVSFKCYAKASNWATKWGIAAGAGQSIDANAAGRVCGGAISKSDTWQDVVMKFNSGDNTKLHIIFQGYGSAVYYIDEVFVVKADKIVLNGGFETMLIGWTADSDSFTTSYTEACEGNSSVNALNGYYSKLSQAIVVEKQTNYKLTFKYKGTVDAVIPNYAVSHTADSFEEGYLLAKGTLKTATDWTEVSALFNSGDNESLYLMFQTTAGCNYYIDCVSIEKTDEQPTVSESGVTPKFGGVHGSKRYACTDGTNLVTDSGFEAENGNWTSLLADGVLSVTDKEAKNGSKALKFSADGLEETSRNAFYVEVEPNTDYIFSTWVKGERRSTSNRNDMEFGVIDVNTGKFLPSVGNGNTDRVYTYEHQLSPLSWDNEWHITGLTFNSGTATHIGIMIKGAASVAYFDDMYICKLDEAQEYVSPEDSKAEMKIVELEAKLLGCDDKDNLIDNFDFSESSGDFWQTGKVFGNQVTVEETGGTKGKALHYEPVSEIPYRTYYIKYVDVKPNTDYTFSAKYTILKAGDGFFGIINGNRKLPTTTIQYVFDESRYNEDCKWQNVGITFNTGGYDRVGFVVCDIGGEAYIDNVRLFETANAKQLVETDSFPKKITSDTYKVGDGVLTGISENTTLKDLLGRLNESKYIRVFKDGTEITDLSALAATDLELRLMDGPEIKQRLKLIVNGDVNGDGKCDTLDSDVILKYLTKQAELSENKAKAADADKDGEITIRDAVKIIGHATGKLKIK